MRTIVALEKRFERTPDGRVWATGWLNHTFWERYLEVFREVLVVARLREVQEVAVDAQRADRDGVSFLPVPYYVGPGQFLRRYGAIQSAIRDALGGMDAVILRVPGQIGNMVAHQLQAAGRPYGVEVVGDPYEVFASGAVRSRIRWVLRWWMPSCLRRQCRAASAVAYVTAGSLQRRYPAGERAFITSYSSVDLPSEAFATPRRTQPVVGMRKILFIGSLDQLYKGPDLLIRALSLLARQGHSLYLTIVGDGRHRSDLQDLAQRCGVAASVRFAGVIPPGAPVRGELDDADLFVLPSRTEGLPRALIEAMARGLPCLGSRVGGIPELLSPQELVPAGDATALAAKIDEVVSDGERMARLSADNLEKARGFSERVLRPRRMAFYKAVHDATNEWSGNSAG